MTVGMSAPPIGMMSSTPNSKDKPITTGKRALSAGLTARIAPTVNVGNVHFAPGRHAVTPSVFLGDPELQTLRSLEDEGFSIEARAIPAEPPAGMAEIERRYAAAR